MRNILTLSEKELRSYFASPMAYIVTAAFLVVAGWIFAFVLINSRQATMQDSFQGMAIIMLLVSPVLAMRLLAEEQRTGTIELLLTSPVRDFEVVLGKFLASLALFIVMLGFTLYYVFLLTRLGNPDAGPILAGYLGMVLAGAAFLAIGLLYSSLTSNQVIAAFLTIVTLLVLLWFDALSSSFSPSISAVTGYLSLTRHLSDLPRGIIDTKDIVYFLSLIVACLFMTVRSLETRRWR
ncbi:MAG: ABC transporter permease subunit [Chloroflexi bacterium]|nr:ABC transporter permease subunit [Chloroflexota bacterium]